MKKIKAYPSNDKENYKGGVIRAREAPNFGKLHKQWDEKLQKGKAVNKKPLTQSQPFQLSQRKPLADDGFICDENSRQAIFSQSSSSPKVRKPERSTIAGVVRPPSSFKSGIPIPAVQRRGSLYSKRSTSTPSKKLLPTTSQFPTKSPNVLSEKSCNVLSQKSPNVLARKDSIKSNKVFEGKSADNNVKASTKKQGFEVNFQIDPKSLNDILNNSETVPDTCLNIKRTSHCGPERPKKKMGRVHPFVMPAKSVASALSVEPKRKLSIYSRDSFSTKSELMSWFKKLNEGKVAKKAEHQNSLGGTLVGFQGVTRARNSPVTPSKLISSKDTNSHLRSILKKSNQHKDTSFDWTHSNASSKSSSMSNSLKTANTPIRLSAYARERMKLGLKVAPQYRYEHLGESLTSPSQFEASHKPSNKNLSKKNDAVPTKFDNIRGKVVSTINSDNLIEKDESLLVNKHVRWADVRSTTLTSNSEGVVSREQNVTNVTNAISNVAVTKKPYVAAPSETSHEISITKVRNSPSHFLKFVLPAEQPLEKHSDSSEKRDDSKENVDCLSSMTLPNSKQSWAHVLQSELLDGVEKERDVQPIAEVSSPRGSSFSTQTLDHPSVKSKESTRPFPPTRPFPQIEPDVIEDLISFKDIEQEEELLRQSLLESQKLKSQIKYPPNRENLSETPCLREASCVSDTVYEVVLEDNEESPVNQSQTAHAPPRKQTRARTPYKEEKFEMYLKILSQAKEKQIEGGGVTSNAEMATFNSSSSNCIDELSKSCSNISDTYAVIKKKIAFRDDDQTTNLSTTMKNATISSCTFVTDTCTAPEVPQLSCSVGANNYLNFMSPTNYTITTVASTTHSNSSKNISPVPNTFNPTHEDHSMIPTAGNSFPSSNRLASNENDVMRNDQGSGKAVFSHVVGNIMSPGMKKFTGDTNNVVFGSKLQTIDNKANDQDDKHVSKRCEWGGPVSKPSSLLIAQHADANPSSEQPMSNFSTGNFFNATNLPSFSDFIAPAVSNSIRETSGFSHKNEKFENENPGSDMAYSKQNNNYQSATSKGNERKTLTATQPLNDKGGFHLKPSSFSTMVFENDVRSKGIFTDPCANLCEKVSVPQTVAFHNPMKTSTFSDLATTNRDISRTNAPDRYISPITASDRDISRMVATNRDIPRTNASGRDISSIAATNRDISRMAAPDRDISHMAASNRDISRMAASNQDISRTNAPDQYISHTNAINGDISVVDDDDSLSLIEDDDETDICVILPNVRKNAKSLPSLPRNSPKHSTQSSPPTHDVLKIIQPSQIAIHQSSASFAVQKTSSFRANSVRTESNHVISLSERSAFKRLPATCNVLPTMLPTPTSTNSSEEMSRLEVFLKGTCTFDSSIDAEVSLMCKFAAISAQFSPGNRKMREGSLNPVAELLTRGDSQHFIPISNNTR